MCSTPCESCRDDRKLSFYTHQSSRNRVKVVRSKEFIWHISSHSLMDVFFHEGLKASYFYLPISAAHVRWQSQGRLASTANDHEACHLFSRQKPITQNLPTPVDHGINETRKSRHRKSSSPHPDSREKPSTSFCPHNTYTQQILGTSKELKETLHFRSCSRSTSYMKSKYGLSKWCTRT